MKVAILLALMAMTSSAIAAAPKAPEPARPVDGASLFSGRWYEFARTPKSFNAGCVAGVTDYTVTKDGITERDACHDKTPDGKEQALSGALKILNPGTNTKVDVAYRILGGLFPVHREYWVLDHGDDWFMIANPEMTEVNLYSRNPRPLQALMDRMTKQIKELGYAGPLEFPTLSAARP